MVTQPQIRFIKPDDYAGALTVYAPYVLHTAITFDYEVPTLQEFSAKLNSIVNHYPCLVCEVNGVIAGYCYGGIHRVKTAYQWSVESTIYIAEAYHHKGIAAIMYTCLFDILRIQGFINVYAGVSVPNGKSDRFHASYGFKYIGCFPEIGYKFGQWHDLKWYEYNLAPHTQKPLAPIPISEIKDSMEVRAALAKANR